ncbi:quinone oxidoreductase family protein [Leptospirillum ferriphilum]|uniref:NADPH2:quinone reductase n=1 Tax=Leptospirillum ferriphilum TaxID=178606 RepID=A0A2I2MFX9_9BACT|nr:zinc-binding alcohol dehydrogenase family protein [Leptospirillum ferriphilum]
MEQKTMRAALIRGNGEDAEVGYVPEPARGPGKALVKVQAGSINPLDLLISSGKFYLGHPPFPYVPGVEGVGIVIEGDKVAPGTRVRFECGVLSPYGSLAPLTVVEENAVMFVPEDAPDDLVACLGISGLAAWLSLAWRAKMAKGERVLVLGATGAVGQIAIQVAKLLGASRIVGASRNRNALDEVLSLGADAIVELDEHGAPELAVSFTEAAGGPIDVVIDTLWGTPALGAMMAAGLGARVVNIGQIAGDAMSIPSAVLRGKMISLLGHNNLFVPKEERQKAFGQLLEHAMRGDLRVKREAIPLERVSDAWRLQRESPHHKLVVFPS